MRRAALIALVCAAAGACEAAPPPAPRFAMSFRATADGTRPLAGVAVAIAGRDVGATGADGRLEVSWRTTEGTSLPLSAACPAGYRDAEVAQAITLRRFRALEGDHLPPVEVGIDCAPAERTAVLVVRAAERADLPILVNGRARGRTDASGVAHVYLRREPGRLMQVTLQTEHEPRLRPRNPSIAFRLEDADAIFVFDQAFELAPAPKRRRRKANRGASPAPGPVNEAPATPVRPIRIQ